MHGRQDKCAGVKIRLEIPTPICLRSTLRTDKEIASAARRRGSRKNTMNCQGWGLSAGRPGAGDALTAGPAAAGNKKRPAGAQKAGKA